MKSREPSLPCSHFCVGGSCCLIPAEFRQAMHAETEAACANEVLPSHVVQS